MHKNIIGFFSFLFITKWWRERESREQLRYKHRVRYGILSEPFLLRSAFTRLVQGQFKTFNHLHFFFVLLSRDWYRANSKHLIISASICFSTTGPSQGTPSFFWAVWMHYTDANWTYGEKAWRQLHKNAANNIEKVLGQHPTKPMN